MELLPDILGVLETFYDAVPRSGARSERIGPLELFVREGTGRPDYARPALGAGLITADDVRAVLARQQELAVPQAFEWVHELAPSLTSAAQAAGLAVEQCPLLVWEATDLAGHGGPSVGQPQVHLAEPDDPALAAAEAVAAVAFSAGIGTQVGRAGIVERNVVEADADVARLARVRESLRSGHQARVIASDADGPLGVGGYQRVGEVAEIVGVATLPAARRQGVAAAVTTLLASSALASGCTTVFLSAQDQDVARVYERVGFRRVGTAGLAEPAQTT